MRRGGRIVPAAAMPRCRQRPRAGADHRPGHRPPEAAALL